MRKPFIIAEAGSCHEESLERALQLVAIAQLSGCDAVKFQYWSSPERMRARRRVSHEQAYARGSIHADWLVPLKREARDRKLLFSATVYLPEDISVLDPHVDYWKVASFEARDRALTHDIAYDTRPFFISTGMFQEHESSYLPKRAIQMRCVSAYPCPPDQANLSSIARGGGYSDHTRCLFTGAFAVSAGADYLEVHFRLADTSPDCPDYIVALDPEGLEKYVGLARSACPMRGTGAMTVQAAEQGML